MKHKRKSNTRPAMKAAGREIERKRTLGEEIIDGLSELIEVAESGQPLSERFRVDDFSHLEALRQILAGVHDDANPLRLEWTST